MSFFAKLKPSLVRRGIRLSKRGAVLSYEYLSDTECVGKVVGSKEGIVYDAVVPLQTDKTPSCTCAYFAKDKRICKHVIALYVTIRSQAVEEYEEERQRRRQERQQDRKNKKELLTSRIDEMNENQLREMLKEAVSRMGTKTLTYFIDRFVGEQGKEMWLMGENSEQAVPGDLKQTVTEEYVPPYRMIRKKKNNNLFLQYRPVETENNLFVLVNGQGVVVTDCDLMQKLRQERISIANERQVAAYTIFNNKALTCLATGKPTTKEEFVEVYGISDKVYSLYGERILSVIRAHEESKTQEV